MKRIRDVVGGSLFFIGSLLTIWGDITFKIIGCFLETAGVIILFFPKEEKEDGKT